MRTVGLRKKLRISVGDNGDKQMLRAIRVHSNFSEYVPFALILIYFCSVMGAADNIIHFLSALLLVGRISHAYGLSDEKTDFRFRLMGMVLTFAVLFLSAGYLIFCAWSK